MPAPSPIRVGVSGAAGRMGREVVAAVSGDADLVLCAAIDRVHVGEDSGALAGIATNGIIVRDDLASALTDAHCDVLVDFTQPESAADNARIAVRSGVRPVIGTSGVVPEDRLQLDSLLRGSSLGGLLVPNFALGAVLMMKFAAEAASYFPKREIIELHHDRKLDAPSGTAIRTAEMMSQNPGRAPDAGSAARGEVVRDVHIHSVRLPGLVAHQEVLFGGPGEMLTIRHDSFDRKCFMPGVLLAIRKVFDVEGLVVGLEAVL